MSRTGLCYYSAALRCTVPHAGVNRTISADYGRMALPKHSADTVLHFIPGCEKNQQALSSLGRR